MESWLIPAAPVTVVEEIKRAASLRCWRIPMALRRQKRLLNRCGQSTPMPGTIAWRGWRVRRMILNSWVSLTTGSRRERQVKPMLAQLMGSGVGEITAVVVRYYGGILLGTGGLVKAYGGGVNQALRQLTTQRKTPLTEYTLQCEYSQLTGIEALLGQCDGKIINSDYQAFVLLRVALPAAKVAEFSAKLADFSRGSLQLLAIEE